jgi:hypothetical protein
MPNEEIQETKEELLNPDTADEPNPAESDDPAGLDEDGVRAQFQSLDLSDDDDGEGPAPEAPSPAGDEATPPDEGEEDKEPPTDETPPGEAGKEEKPAAEKKEEDGKEPSKEEKTGEEIPPGKSKEELEAETAAAVADADAIIKAAEEQRSAIVDVLASKYYEPRLTDEMLEELRDGDARKVLPRLQAELYVDAVQGITGMLMQNLPALVDMVIKGNNVAAEAEQKFFEKFPMFKDEKYRPDLERVAQTYIKLHPNTDLETRMRDIGLQMCLMHKVTPPGMESAPQPPDEPPPTPAGSAPTASPGGAPAEPLNPFARLYEESLEDD